MGRQHSVISAHFIPQLAKKVGTDCIHHPVDYIVTFLKIPPFQAKEQRPITDLQLFSGGCHLMRLLSRTGSWSPSALSRPRGLVCVWVRRTVSHTLFETSSSVACVCDDEQDEKSSSASLSSADSYVIGSKLVRL